MSTGDLSLEQQVALLSAEEQDAVLSALTEDALAELSWDWHWTGRPSQILPIGPVGDPQYEWEMALLNAGRGWGKLLTLDTPIPTPSGWTTMGELSVGDQVLDEAGQPTSVVWASEVQIEDTWKVSFSDGSSLYAHGEHQWVTWTHAERKAFLRSPYEDTSRFPANWPQWRLKRSIGRYPNDPKVRPDSPGPQIRTTNQIRKTLRFGKRGDLNHCIPTTAPLQLPEADLLVDPYVLGAWLGDGSTGSGTFTCHQGDQTQLLAELSRAGYQATVNGQRVGTRGLTTQLGVLGVLKDKHVPVHYLRSSISQREALLAGLMDTDGSVQLGGQVEFSNTNRALIDAVYELAASLGQKPRISDPQIGTLNGVNHKTYWRVTWQPTRQVFRLERKATVVTGALGRSQSLRNHHRMITAIEQVPTVPMRCITVDSPNSLYLAGRAMIPTHNTLAGSQYIREMDERWHTLGRDPGEQLRVALLGRTAADVRDTILNGRSGLLNIYPPSLQDQVEWISTQRRVNLPGGGFALCFSAEEPDQLRGPQFHIGWGDELAAYKQVKGAGELDAWTNLRIATRLGKLSQLIATTTPKRVKILRELIAEIKASGGRMILRTGKTTDNAHLSASYLNTLFSLYGGTTLGAQELDGLMLDAVEGATVTAEVIEDTRVNRLPRMENTPWARVISVDPSVAEKPNDECGIVVIYAPLTQPILSRHAYVVDDLSIKASPGVWADRVISAAVKHRATVVVENNQGGALVRRLLKEAAAAADVPPPQIREVWSVKSKAMRAEPIGAAYQRGRVHHLNNLPDLEDQLTTWTPTDSGYSPDRLDAVVHGLAALLFPEAMTKGGMPGASASHSPVGTPVPVNRPGRNTRRPAGLRIDTSGAGARRAPGLPTRVAVPRVTIPTRSR